MSYEPRKAAQLIVYLILKSGGPALNVLKAVKLVYMIDRESIKALWLSRTRGKAVLHAAWSGQLANLRVHHRIL